MKFRWNKYYFYFSVVIAIIFFIYYFQFPSKVRKETFERDVRLEFNGRVVKKFINVENHNYEMLHIKSGDDTISFLLNFDLSGLFDYVRVGDSIVKYEDKTRIIVITERNSKEFFLKYE